MSIKKQAGSPINCGVSSEKLPPAPLVTPPRVKMSAQQSSYSLHCDRLGAIPNECDCGVFARGVISDP